MTEAVVLLSGGMDSATAAYEAREKGYEIAALHTSYGQRTEGKEYECARWLADELGAADFLHIETDHLAAIGGSSLTDESMAVAGASDNEKRSSSDPAEEPRDDDGIPNTYVPFRNANLLSMAVSYAEARGAEAIYVGAHTEDFAGYPDCRPAFFEAFQGVVDAGTRPETEIRIEVPYVEASKTAIAERGLELGVPYEHTWSCYREEAPACGTCDSCQYRREAFERAGSEDPIRYAQP